MQFNINLKNLGLPAQVSLQEYVVRKFTMLNDKLTKLKLKIEPKVSIDVEYKERHEVFEVKVVLLAAGREFVLKLVDENFHKAIDYAIHNLRNQLMEHKDRLRMNS